MLKSKAKRLGYLKANFRKIKEETFNFRQIERFFLFSDKKNIFQTISDRTFRDLDMDEVFMFIDRTASKVGQQFLYQTLRDIPENQSRIEKFEQIIQILKADPDVQDTVLLEITSLNEKDAYYICSLFLEEHIQKPKWFWVIQLLSLISITSVVLAYFFPKMLILLIFLLPVNFGIHYWNKNNLYQYGSSIPQLLILTRAARKIATLKDIVRLTPRIPEAIRAIDSLGARMAIFRLEVKLQSEIGLFVEYLVEIIKALFLIEPLVLYNVLKELDSKRQHIQDVYSFVGEIDCAMSIHSLREEMPFYCIPGIANNKKHLTAADVFHPLIYQSVPNSITLEGKSVLLTGSNMSGKTTFIRTIGINSILAQTIHTCFAREFFIPAVKIHSAIRISDDLLSDKSYYFEEVLAVKNLLEESKSGCQNLFLLDEIFKGTNTVERIASGKAVLEYLCHENNMVFVAAHDLELAALLKTSFTAFHFTEILQNDQIVFDYKIKPGVLMNTNAIRILELNNYPKAVIDEASQLAGQLYSLKVKEAP